MDPLDVVDRVCVIDKEALAVADPVVVFVNDIDMDRDELCEIVNEFVDDSDIDAVLDMLDVDVRLIEAVLLSDCVRDCDKVCEALCEAVRLLDIVRDCDSEPVRLNELVVDWEVDSDRENDSELLNEAVSDMEYDSD